MSKWKCIEYDWACDLLFFGDNSYWWGAVNIENCKSSNNKRFMLAYYRARKNQTRRFKMLTKYEHIRKLNEEYGLHIKPYKILGGYYIY